MDRAEARRRLEGSTRFQLVGDRVVIRDVALLRAMAKVTSEGDTPPRRTEQDVPLDASLVLAA